ncbi:hypothetical protein [Glycomyces xiaoerkulensis]|uniref:hypothetical protein n=1 Tax=Glycomyces xiaoerkulensis TaxID=2038139 RepID=UPI0012FFF42D|nr:hypothetical protein [Glycomyces xiaoerkulensis]
MPYIVLQGEMYNLLADAVEANGGKAYRHIECIEEAGSDAPITSVTIRFAHLILNYEHPDPARNRTIRVPYPAGPDAVDQAASLIVEIAEHPG